MNPYRGCYASLRGAQRRSNQSSADLDFCYAMTPGVHGPWVASRADAGGSHDAGVHGPCAVSGPKQVARNDAG